MPIVGWIANPNKDWRQKLVIRFHRRLGRRQEVPITIQQIKDRVTLGRIGIARCCHHDPIFQTVDLRRNIVLFRPWKRDWFSCYGTADWKVSAASKDRAI